MIKTFATAALLGLGLCGPLATSASAFPVAEVPALDGAQIIPVYGGCGPFGHRGPYGGCRTGGQWGGYIRGRSCPAGFHIGPYGRRCWPNGF